jgi:hypothetical protein
MLIWLLGCAVVPPEQGSVVQPLVMFTVDVPTNFGRAFASTALGVGLDDTTEVTVEVVDVAHPGRNQAILCPFDDPVQGCATLDWSVGDFALRRGERSVYLWPDGGFADVAFEEEASLALGAVPVRFTGQLDPGEETSWSIELPVIYLSGNAPDGYRSPARLEVSVWETTR